MGTKRRSVCCYGLRSRDRWAQRYAAKIRCAGVRSLFPDFPNTVGCVNCGLQTKCATHRLRPELTPPLIVRHVGLDQHPPYCLLFACEDVKYCSSVGCTKHSHDARRDRVCEHFSFRSYNTYLLGISSLPTSALLFTTSPINTEHISLQSSSHFHIPMGNISDLSTDQQEKSGLAAVA